MKKSIPIIYIVLLHLFIAFLVVKTDFIQRVKQSVGLSEARGPELTDHYYRMVDYHKRIDKNILPGAYIFFGASHVQGLCVSSIACPSVNYGIGWDTSYGVLKRLQFYGSVYTAKALIVAVGGNDIRHRRKIDEILGNFHLIVRTVPQEVSVLICSVFPVGLNARNQMPEINDRIRELNNRLKKLCETKTNCTFVDMTVQITNTDGYLNENYQAGDGVHLNWQGYDIWIQKIKSSLEAIKNMHLDDRTIS